MLAKNVLQPLNIRPASEIILFADCFLVDSTVGSPEYKYGGNEELLMSRIVRVCFHA